MKGDEIQGQIKLQVDFHYYIMMVSRESTKIHWNYSSVWFGSQREHIHRNFTGKASLHEHHGHRAWMLWAGIMWISLLLTQYYTIFSFYYWNGKRTWRIIHQYYSLTSVMKWESYSQSQIWLSLQTYDREILKVQVISSFPWGDKYWY